MIVYQYRCSGRQQLRLLLSLSRLLPPLRTRRMIVDHSSRGQRLLLPLSLPRPLPLGLPPPLLRLLSLPPIKRMIVDHSSRGQRLLPSSSPLLPPHPLL